MSDFLVEDPPTYDQSPVARVGWRMDLYATMYKTCANGHQGAVGNMCICLRERAPTGGHKQRLGRAHGWNVDRAGGVVHVSAMRCVTLLDRKDGSWWLVGVGEMDGAAKKMGGGDGGRTLAYHPGN